MDVGKEVVKIGKGAVSAAALSMLITLTIAVALRKAAVNGKLGTQVQEFTQKYL